MDVLHDNKTYGIIGRVGSFSIAKIRCGREKFNFFSSNHTLNIKINNKQIGFSIIRTSTKRLKNGQIKEYVTFLMTCPHQYVSLMLYLFKKHDLNKLQEEISQLQLDLGMLS